MIKGWGGREVLWLIPLFLFLGKGGMVPVAPNESIVEAEVLEYSILNSLVEGIKPEQILHSLRIRILSSKPRGNKLDFLKGRIGQVVKVYSREPISPVVFGKKILCHLSYLGDEWGGRFWVGGIKIQR